MSEENITYGRLDEVLRGLHFTLQLVSDGKTRLYAHQATGSVVLLPALPFTESVLPPHLLATKMVLDAYGIADPHTFTNQLLRAS